MILETILDGTKYSVYSVSRKVNVTIKYRMTGKSQTFTFPDADAALIWVGNHFA